MRNSFLSVQFWAFAMLLIGLSPIGTLFAPTLGWSDGAATFAILAVPTVVAALYSAPKIAVTIAVFAAMGCIGEVVFSDHVSGAQPQFSFAFVASALLIGFNAAVSTIVDQMRKEQQSLQDQNADYVRELYRRNKKNGVEAEQGTLSQNDPQGLLVVQEKTAQTITSDETVDYAMLLLTLQDIGRRISSNLSLESLLPTILSSAKGSLKCDVCQIYFWDENEKVLRNANPVKSQDRSSYVPRKNAGMAQWVIQNRQILTRRDLEEDINLNSLLEEEPHSPDAIAPLAVGGELLGIIIVDEVAQDTTTFVRLLYILANIYALGIKNAQLFQRIEDMARKDGLTGLINHASFQEEIQRLTTENTAESESLSVIMSDIDHFKKFNDTYGHQAGDYVLREVSRLWTAVMPDYAIVARYGGEEFICALPGDDKNRAKELAEELRKLTEQFPFSFEGQQLSVTSSFGVSEWNQKMPHSDELIRTADEALYAAKEAGRNQVVCSHAAVKSDAGYPESRA